MGTAAPSASSGQALGCPGERRPAPRRSNKIPTGWNPHWIDRFRPLLILMLVAVVLSAASAEKHLSVYSTAANY
ncbi:MAG: hypothetical protein ABSF15_10065, partial [Candidatus Sulfotelmatobacter sp.]